MNGINYKQREIVLVPFPYSDLSAIKKRPVLILSNDKYNQRHRDVIVAVITSVSKPENEYSVHLGNNDLEYGVLPEKSSIKVHKIFTIDKSRIIKKFSLIKEEKYEIIYNKIINLFAL